MASTKCALIGQGPILIACAERLRNKSYEIQGVISDCEQVRSWCAQTGIRVIGTGDEQVEFLSSAPFEFLFSIVNHKVISPSVLALPTRAAINFHDSPLPDYAGFNATAWAIIDGKETHGVTWHRMTEKVDEGDILVSESVAINDDDTAFTLSTKCGDAALRTFDGLLDRLQRDDLDGTAQGPTTNFHLKSARPGVGFLDWNEPARLLTRRVRGLDFGPDESWLSTPKFKTPQGRFLRAASAAVAADTGVAPGTVTQFTGDRITVSTQGSSVELTDITTLEGQALTETQLEETGLATGVILPSHDQAEIDLLDELDAKVTRTERFWCARLVDFEQTTLAEITEQDGPPTQKEVSELAPQWVRDLPCDAQGAALLAAVGLYLSRTGGSPDLVRFAWHSAKLADAQKEVFSEVTPSQLTIPAEGVWSDLIDVASTELAEQTSRRTFAHDVKVRYPNMRELPTFAERASIAVTASSSSSLPAGISLCFGLDEMDGRIQVAFDSRAVPQDTAQMLARRIACILRQGENSTTPLRDISPLTEAEGKLLLETWQDTKTGYASDKCVHQLIEEQVQRTPDDIALVFQGESLTYAELDMRANAVARTLINQGVGVDDLIGVCVARSLDMMVALVGVMKAGAAYVPLDPAYPVERLSIMLGDSRARVLITSADLRSKLPEHDAQVVLMDDIENHDGPLPEVRVAPNNLAYVIFTSGSTGRPKGVMVEHGNVSNFFTGMDATIGPERGTWLAVTSISFDISVLELFWTLARGFKVVIQEESDRASRRNNSVKASNRPMGFGMFYFAAQQGGQESVDMYRLLLEGAKFADKNGFSSVWTPERHFHEFGGIYPNPAVTTAALAAVTERVPLRAGSVVLPLHNPIRVAEDWAVCDILSNGRIGLSFASGWHANDFALMPENFENRRALMQEQIATVRKLWAGETIAVTNGTGQEIQVGAYPRPIQEKPPLWIATAGTPETFRVAGEKGFNILTNMLGQDIEKLRENFAAYRAAWKEAGHSGDGVISVMLHTFICGDDEEAKELARGPFCRYMASSYDLTKVAPWMFPAFKQPSSKKDNHAFDPASFDDDDKEALLEHAFERYFDTAGLFGTPERALKMVEQLKEVGCNEIACLIDFGVDPQTVIDNFEYLNELRQISNPKDAPVKEESSSVGEQIEKHGVTHLQCTPSMARLLLAEGAMPAMARLKKLLLGGEALPLDLVGKLKSEFKGELWNMYGPTEATIWSTTSLVQSSAKSVTIGRPIANTTIRILGSDGRLAPIGVPGELCIGGAGVVRGYFGQPEMTKERFIEDPYCEAELLYRTGDLARYKLDGELDFLGRLDQQVKLNGYRIEMGEIETILSRHPSVRDSVVVAHEQGGSAQLVAYMVTGQNPDGESEVDERVHVASWEKLWSGAYQQGVGADESDPRFNTSGWLSSFTGEPVAQKEMRHWAGATVERMLERSPKDILEIGCGTGMLLYGALADVGSYTGVDVSDQALEGIRAQLTPEEKNKVNLFNSPAHELSRLNIDKVDLVVINSVAQYFPNGEYLESVLKAAASVVKEGGHILLGDLRSLEHLRAFHSIVELHQAPGQRSALSLKQKVEERQRLESELLVSQDFFAGIGSRLPGLSLESIQLKRGTDATEMTLLRYDVLLTVGEAGTELSLPAAKTGITQESELRAALSEKPPLVLALGLQNARLAPVLRAMREIDAGQGQAEHLRQLLESDTDAIQPESLYTLSDEYDVEMRWGAKDGEVDVLFRNKQSAPSGTWRLTPRGTLETTNTPTSVETHESVVPSVRKHLRDFLPEYMVPTAYVTLGSLPLTPNGKIDRKSLPAPGKESVKTAQAYVTPQNDLEKTIAAIWREMLGIERVGIKDNIFDLGASSLLTVEANSRLSSALNKKIPLVNMFRYPTVESLAKHLGADLTPKKDESAQQDRKQAAIERRRAARAARLRT